MMCTLKCKLFSTPLIPLFLIAFAMRCVQLINQKKMDATKFTSIFIVVTFMLGNISWIVALMRSQVFDLGILSSTMEYLAMPPTQFYQSMNLTKEENNKDKLGLVNVTYKYGDKVVIDNMTMSFEPGQRTVITGPIGAGKSTLLKLLMRFYEPSEGDLFIDNTWYSTMSNKQVRRKIGYVPQDPILFNRSIIENIMYGNSKSNTDEVRRIVSSLGIYEDLDASVGKSGSRLSGGQRQLVWCLRVLFRDPEVIIMDEPTASMDDTTKKVLVQLLSTLGRNKTILMVTHDDFLINSATRKINLRM